MTRTELADDIEAHAWADFYAAAPAEQGCASYRVPGTDATLLLARSMPAPILNRVIGLSRQDVLDGEALTWCARAYREAGIGNYWLHAWPEDGDAQVATVLERHGWTHQESVWRKFLVNLDEPARVPAMRTGLFVRPAEKAEAMAAGRIICTSHGLPDSMAPLFAGVVGRRHWQVFFACTADGTPVAAAALFVDGAHAWLGMGSTLPDARRKGAQQLLFATRLAAARAAGCIVAAVETGAPAKGESSPSLNNIRRAGFQDVGGRINYLCRAE